MDDKAAKLFDSLTHNLPFNDLWEQVGTAELHRIECDDREGILGVTVARDGDLHAMVFEGTGENRFGPPSFRARTFGGGGRHERVRRALLLLALAIKADKGR